MLLAHAKLAQALQDAGHKVDTATFSSKMKDPDFAEKVRTALADEGHNVPDSGAFHRKYGYDVGSKSIAGNKQESVADYKKFGTAARDATAAPERRVASGPNAIQKGYGAVRNVLANVPAVAPATMEMLTGEGAFEAVQDPATGRTVAMPIQGKQTPTDRFLTTHAVNKDYYGRGQGIGGMLADPISLASMAVPEAAIARKLGQLYSGSKLAAAAAKAEPYLTGPRVEAALDLARAGAIGAAKGAGYSGLQTALDPEQPQGSVADATLIGGTIGGAGGVIGRGLQRMAVGNFPGIVVGKRNLKVTDDDKRFLAKHLEERVLQPGFLPKTQTGLIKASQRRVDKITDKYDEALTALEREAPDATIDLGEVQAQALRNLEDNYLQSSRSGMVLDPTTALGFKLPDDARQQISDRINSLQASHTGRLAKHVLGVPTPTATGTYNKPTAFADFVDMVTDHPRARDAVKRTGMDTYNPMAAQSLRASLLPQDKAASYLGEYFVGPAVSEAVGTKLSPEAARYARLISRLSDDPNSPFAAALGQRYMSDAGDEAKSLASAQKLNEILGAHFDPREFNRARSSMLDPKTWLNPTTGTPAAEAKELGDALHRASVEQLKFAGEPGKVDAAGKRIMGPFGQTLGDADKDYRFEMALDRLLNSPGNIGLADRINFLGSNAAVGPWLKIGAQYKLGQGLRSGLVNPSIAQGLGSLAIDPAETTKRWVNNLGDWRRQGYMPTTDTAQ